MTKEYLRVEEYLDQARKIVGKLGGDMKHRLLQDDDVMGSVATNIMLADQKWDPNYPGGACSLGTLRVKYALWMVIECVNKIKKHKMLSMSYTRFDDAEPMGNYIEGPDEEKIRDDLAMVDDLINHKSLTKKESEVVRLRYMGYTLDEIGQQVGFSKERARQLLQNAGRKIRKYVEMD